VADKQREELEILIDYATLKAPFDGVITQRHVDPGDLVKNTQASGGNSDKPLFVVAQVDRVRIQVTLPERETPWADVGDSATIELQALPGKKLSGKVARVSSSLDESTRSMMVEIDLPNPELKILPGMFGEATLVLEEHKDRQVLPVSAVRHDQTGRSFVYVINADNEVQIVDVTTGLDDGDQIEIVGGLTGDERVAGATVDRLEPGQKVNIRT
jgi:RND family efflux transporter MFP subunit